MKILVFLDYSSFTEQILSAVNKLKSSLAAAEISVLHVIDERSFYATTGYESVWAQQLTEESKKLKSLCELHLDNGITYIEENGIPKLKIDEALHTSGYDMVVIGSHSHGLGERLLGSIAEHVLRTYKKPVLIIP